MKLSLTECSRNLAEFIDQEKMNFNSLNLKTEWSETHWNCKDWLFSRNNFYLLPFTKLTSPDVGLPLPYSDFAKAVVVHIQRTRDAGINSCQKYLIECRRLFQSMEYQNISNPCDLKRFHFDRALELLEEAGYRNMYDAASTLKVIASIVDKYKITLRSIEFNHSYKVTSTRNSYVPISEMGSDKARAEDEKLPSLEAFKAYAQCTNNPIDDDEEVLLRTIDLLIVMGQRGNEVTLIPFDCWVEQDRIGKNGKPETDINGKNMVEVGIRYYPEKKLQAKTHWLAQQDIPFARRAVDRLKYLTSEARQTAKWQEENDEKLWSYGDEEEVSDEVVLKFLQHENFDKLAMYLLHNKIKPTRMLNEQHSRQPGQKGGIRFKHKRMYRAGDIPALFKVNHSQLQQRKGNNLTTILKTSDILSVFFKIQRGSFKNKLWPIRITLAQINKALGSIGDDSIFDRRNLTELDGSRIALTSHQPRHWRNTIYEMSGMTNVQQALALGRQRLDQNKTYQHTSILEKTSLHRAFLSFRNNQNRIQFLHDSIKNGVITGELSDMYHEIKQLDGESDAQMFLDTHATALHITPFGGCTHDFSLNPCPKHLECYNGCGHLHRTNSDVETENLSALIKSSRQALTLMQKSGEGDFGSDKWTMDLQQKISNMEKALAITPGSKPVQVFPGGKEVTKAVGTTKKDSV